MAAYLQVLSDFSSQIVSVACDKFCKRKTRFPPTSGEIYEECLSVAAEKKRQEQFIDAGRPRPTVTLLPPLRKNWTQEELANESILINHISPPYYIRPGRDYGYLTKLESDWIKNNNIKKTTPFFRYEAAE